jgi:hypothetical protein
MYHIALLDRSYCRRNQERMQDQADGSHGDLIDPVRRSYLHLCLFARTLKRDPKGLIKTRNGS